MNYSNEIVPPVDSSQFDELFLSVVNEVGNLRGTLDGFASGRTDELKGARTRDAINQMLDKLEHTLQEMQHLRDAPAAHLNKFVTATMREKVRQTREIAGIVQRKLFNIDSGFRERGIRRRPTVETMYMQQALVSYLVELETMMETSNPGSDLLNSAEDRADTA